MPTTLLRTIRARLWAWVWGVDLDAMSTARRVFARAVQIVYVVTQELVNGDLNLRASSLAYTTLLSLVPALAVSFAVMKGFGVHNELQPTLLDFLSPLGEGALTLTEQVMSFVTNLDLRALGSVGVAVLLLTIVSMVLKVEQAMNFVWRIDRATGALRRISGHLTVVMVGPALLFIAIGVMAKFTTSDYIPDLLAFEYLGPVLSPAIAFASALVPYLLVVAAFAFVYLYMPSTRVQVQAALLGACVAGALWAAVGWGFATLLVASPRNALIYSGFAIPVLFITWLYIGWLIFLVGGSVAYYFQHPEQLAVIGRHPQISSRVRERLGLTVCAHVARRFSAGQPPVTRVELARLTSAPLEAVDHVLGVLMRGELLVRVQDDPPGYMPARALHTIAVRDILLCLRHAFERHHLSHQHMHMDPQTEAFADQFEVAAAEAVGSRTLADLSVSAEVVVIDAQATGAPSATR